jgi:CRISPR-associated protein Csm2
MPPDNRGGRPWNQQAGRGNPAPRQGGGGGWGGGGAGQETVAMPQSRPVKYFADPARKAIDPQLVGALAEKLALETAFVPASQMRRFYGDVLALDRRLVPGADIPAEAVQAHMALLKAKAAYAHRRADSKPKHFPQELLQFFVDHAAGVRDQTDFEAFRRAFEALIAYHKFYAKGD